MTSLAINTLPRADQPLSPDVLAEALRRHELFMVYQPLVDAACGRLVGFEALMRWQSAERGFVSPDSFIPLAESCSIIHQLWDLLLEEVARDRGLLDKNQQPAMHFALNLSAQQLPHVGFAGRFGDWLASRNIDGSQVHVEITESALMADSRTVFDNLVKMSDMGVSIWLDDFGTGYSSLRHLKKLPINGLKIDRSFVRAIENDQADFRIVSAIVAMANSLGMKTVAEGVETEAQVRILTQIGCNTLQGYLIGRPDSLGTLTRTWSPRN